MATQYWLVNFKTKEYLKFTDTGDFFDGDWKAKTAFSSENYIDLVVVKVSTDQVVSDYMIWAYDLCYSGMIVGLYFDKAHVTPEAANTFLKDLRTKQDVAQVYVHSLSLVSEQ